MIILISNNTVLPFAYEIPLLHVQGIHTNIQEDKNLRNKRKCCKSMPANIVAAWKTVN